jgi:myo-inositol-1(or 4)-monophosphatase
VPVDVTRVARIAEAAGALIRDARAEPLDITEKAGAGPVTRADRAADAFLRERLLDLYDCGWLSEETADAPERLVAEHVWVVDPLDGTKEFLLGLPEFAVSVALVRAGRPVLAVVHEPANGTTCTAARGAGAFAGGRRARVREGRRLLASRAEFARGEFEAFRADWQVRPLGSIALKLARVAAGRAAATLSRGPKHEWDVCAGTLLVEEAGGTVTDLAGAVLAFNRPDPRIDGIVAGAPDACARAQRRATELGPVRGARAGRA